MRDPEYSSVDPKTGNVTYSGPLTVEKGDHSHMPGRTDAYLPGDERGHVNASSLGGVNTTDNIVPQHADVNHGAYLSVENGERAELKSGAVINSEKTAVVNGSPGERPSAFTVNDTVTYADGHTESIHSSFTNESYADQSAWNDISASMPGTFDAPNPGDGLRSSTDAASYASLMTETNASLPDLDADYAPADFSGAPGAADTGASADINADLDDGPGDAGSDPGAGPGGDDGPSADPDSH